MRLNKKAIELFLANLNAIHTESHFVGTSGKHLNAYVNKDALGCDPRILESLAYELGCRVIEQVGTEGLEATIGAPMGAIAFGNRVALHLDSSAKAYYVEKTGNGQNDPFEMRKSFADAIEGKSVICVEDIINTGGSAEKTIKAVKDVGGIPLGVIAICNRGGVTAKQLGVKFVISLLDVSLDAFDAHDCPMCKARIPMRTDLGHGKKFIVEHPDYPVVP